LIPVKAPATRPADGDSKGRTTMSLKRILALASGGAGDPSALAFAAWLAGQHDAVVEVVPTYPDSAVDMISLGMALGATLSPDAVEELAAAEREMQNHIEAAARRAANEADVVFGAGDGAPRLSVLTRGLRPGLAVSRHAALADLVVIAQEDLETEPGKALLGQALLADRAPVLVARGDPDRLSGPAAIAWDGSPQAGRAVRAALPLLAMASAIDVIQCVSSLDRQAAEPDIDLLNDYLRLHGVGVGVATLVEGYDEGAALIAAAEARQAGLLVAGAWGHSRLRETVFGGATRSFLGHKAGPSLLLAH
jgi:nucleotide-binding universal stress UspA family protein